MRNVPDVIAAVKRGAGPNSPRLTAEVSSVSTQPAPISRSACRVEAGSATRCRFHIVMSPLAADERAGGLHRDPGLLARHRQQAAIGDRRERIYERTDNRHGTSALQS